MRGTRPASTAGITSAGRMACAKADDAWTYGEMHRACERYTEIFRDPPRTHGAAGWQMNVHALRMTQRLGFDYCSDGRGTHPHLPIWNAEPIRCPQFPTTLPTLDELVGIGDVTEDNVAAHLLERTRERAGAGRPRVHAARGTRGHAPRAGVRATDAGLEGPGLHAGPGPHAVRRRGADGAAALHDRSRHRPPAAPARCWSRARSSWATSISRGRRNGSRQGDTRTTPGDTDARQESAGLHGARHRRAFRALRPRGHDRRPVFLPEGQHARLHRPKARSSAMRTGSFARRAPSSSAVRATRSSRTRTSRRRWHFRSSSSADPDEKLCAQFDVIKMKNMYGKQVRGIERSTLRHRRRRQARARVARRQGAGPRRGGPRSSPRCNGNVARAWRCSVSTTILRPSRFRPQPLVPATKRGTIDERPRAAAVRAFRRPMVERKLRPLLPRCNSSLPQAGQDRLTSATKLFVLDTNVLMHDPTSLFRFEEHDIYLPIFTLEELDNNKKGMTRGRAQRAAGEPFPRRARDVARRDRRSDREGHSAGATSRTARRRGGCSCRPRRSSTTLPPSLAGGKADNQIIAVVMPPARSTIQARQVDPGVQGHQHAHQGACAGHGRRGLLQRQGPRGHRSAVLRHARAAGGLLGQARQGHGVVAAGRPHVLPRCTGPLVPSLLQSTSSSTSRRRTRRRSTRSSRKSTARPRCCPRSRTTRTRRTTCGASPRATASRTSRSTCS